MCDESKSIQLAGLVGPILIVVTASEWFNLNMFAAAARESPAAFALHVYLNGTLMFAAGLALVRAHNRWECAWPVLLTLVGWSATLGGLTRMFFAPTLSTDASAITTVVIATLLAIGLYLTFKALTATARAERRPA